MSEMNLESNGFNVPSAMQQADISTIQQTAPNHHSFRYRLLAAGMVGATLLTAVGCSKDGGATAEHSNAASSSSSPSVDTIPGESYSTPAAGGVTTPESTPSSLPSPNQASVPIGSTEAPKPAEGLFGAPVWTLDFTKMSNGPLETNDWNIETGKAPANDEAETNTANSQNLRVENGALILESLPPQGSAGYTSARIDTLNKQNFLYGKLDITAKLPAGAGSWPAIWMLSADNKYESQPSGSSEKYLNDGEIDIEEAIGTRPDVVYGIAHNLANPPTGSGDYFATETVPNDDTTYHDYGLEWTPTKLTFTIDGKAYFSYDKPAEATYKSWPYDQHFYLIIDAALGGSWGDQAKGQFPPDGIDNSKLPSSISIKSISYAKYIGPQ
jgi:beta-glucanase (GH16 family)